SCAERSARRERALCGAPRFCHHGVVRGLIVMTVLLLASCSSSEDIGDASATEDASAGIDASAAIDASMMGDAGAPDAGSSDAGSSDAGSSDAGRRLDAGATIPDAGRRDGGSLCAPGPCTPTCFR